MSDFKIEKGIPIPPKMSGGGRKGKWVSLIEDLKVGNCVTLDNLKEVAAFRLAAKSRGLDAESRKREDGEGIRVWLTEATDKPK